MHACKFLFTFIYFIGKEEQRTTRTGGSGTYSLNTWTRARWSTTSSTSTPTYSSWRRWSRNINIQTKIGIKRKIGKVVTLVAMPTWYFFIFVFEQAVHKNNKFEQVYRDFEMQKVSLRPVLKTSAADQDSERRHDVHNHKINLFILCFLLYILLWFFSFNIHDTNNILRCAT